MKQKGEHEKEKYDFRKGKGDRQRTDYTGEGWGSWDLGWRRGGV